MPPDSPRRKLYRCKTDHCRNILGWIGRGGELVRVVNHAEVARIDRGVVTCEVCHRSIVWDPLAYRVQRQQEIEILASLPKSPA